MKLFKKLFKKKTYGQSNHKLLIIDDNADEIHEVFGINEQRSDELLDMCIHAYHKNQILQHSNAHFWF
jgi:hypothetical protein